MVRTISKVYDIPWSRTKTHTATNANLCFLDSDSTSATPDGACCTGAYYAGRTSEVFGTNCTPREWGAGYSEPFHANVSFPSSFNMKRSTDTAWGLRILLITMPVLRDSLSLRIYFLLTTFLRCDADLDTSNSLSFYTGDCKPRILSAAKGFSIMTRLIRLALSSRAKFS